MSSNKKIKINEIFNPDTFTNENKIPKINKFSEDEEEYSENIKKNKKTKNKKTKKIEIPIIEEEIEDIKFPEDENYDLFEELLITKDESLKPKLKEIIKSIKDNIPNEDKILKSSISDKNKEKALELLIVLNGTNDISSEYTYLKNKINRIINTIPNNLSEKLKNEVIELRNEIDSNIPDIEKIIKSNITKGNKLRALELFDQMNILIDQDEYNENINYLKNEINEIINNNQSKEYIEWVEKQENTNFENDSFITKTYNLNANEDIKSSIYKMVKKYKNLNKDDDNKGLRDKINFCLSLPFNNIKPINTDLFNIYNKLNESLYKMNNVKELIIQSINDRIHNSSSKSILTLKGEPGVGKTKIAETIAEAIGLPFNKISFGGETDVTNLKGSNNVWSSSSSSIFLKYLSKAKCSNMVILLDEIDKIGRTQKGIEVQNALLHILDYEQNNKFKDSYIDEFDHDLSNIWFIISMNDESSLDKALIDRLNIIDVPSYDIDEKIEIIINYTLPKILKNKGLNKDDLQLTKNAAKTIVIKNGLRKSSYIIEDIISKINLYKINMESKNKIPLTYKIEDFTGFPYIIKNTLVSDIINLQKKEKTYKLSIYS